MSAPSPLTSRADELTLGDFIAIQNWREETVILRVNHLEQIGDDIVINDSMITSMGNLVVRLGKTFMVAAE